LARGSANNWIKLQAKLQDVERRHTKPVKMTPITERSIRTIAARKNDLVNILRSSFEGVMISYKQREVWKHKFCTLNEKRITESKLSKTPDNIIYEYGNPLASVLSIQVYDIQKMDWCCINWDSIISITVNGVSYDY
jgi:hypothetical protein